jgi:Asp-tRNA(Asn)/Glu-tRNA(Gln) amidotransferase A subunit family amidase
MPDPSIWREHGEPLLPPLASGPLDGLSVAVKDLFGVGGFPVGAGNPAWLAGAPPEPADAPVVRALREAGAAIAGIARTDELAFSLSGTNAHYGTPPNPRAPSRVTGGSSSGPAAAVAAGQADIGLGTDTAGSIRVPASVCGLFGLRPTHGTISADGVLPLAPSFDTVGWLAPSAAIMGAVGAVLLPPGPVAGPRRLLNLDVPNGPAHLLADALPVPLTPDAAVLAEAELTELLAAFRTVQAAEAWASHGDWISAHPGALAADVEARFRYGATADSAAREAAAATIESCRPQVLGVLDSGTWLMLPAAGGPGHARDATDAAKDAWRQATLRRTVLASAFGLPSCVIPGLLNTAAPEGIALVGPPGADRALLYAAATIEAARGE